MSARLDAVTKAKQAYVVARTTLENRLREQLKEELANMQTQIDLAVRYAYDSGESKANILRAMGTKDYHTLNAALERTRGVTEVVGTDPLDSVYSYDVATGVLSVAYTQHGPDNITGEAEFRYTVLDDGAEVFLSNTPLYSDDYSKKNEVVQALDNRTSGFYYEEALDWVTLGKRSE